MKIPKQISAALKAKYASNPAAPSNLFEFSIAELVSLGYKRSKAEIKDGDILLLDKSGTLFCVIEGVKMLRKQCSEDSLAKLEYYGKKI